jgi:hypothetical protein
MFQGQKNPPKDCEKYFYKDIGDDYFNFNLFLIAIDSFRGYMKARNYFFGKMDIGKMSIDINTDFIQVMRENSNVSNEETL